MRKLILFLLLPLWMVAQTSTTKEQEFDYGIKNNSTQTITTPPYLTTTGMDGTQGKIPSALIEKTDNKQNSLAIDGTGTKYPTVDAVNAAISFVTPEQFGAIGDGVSDDKTAIQNAINSGKMVLMNGNYYSSVTITVINKTTIYGNGKIIVDQNLPAISIQSSYVNIRDIKIQGNGRGTSTNYATTRPLQNGILIDGFYFNNNIDGVVFENLGGSGVFVKNNTAGSATVDSGVKISNCTFLSNLFGIYLDTYGEYNTNVNCIFKNNETGLLIKGGNNSTVGGNIINNRTGVSLLPGINDSHSTMSSTTINHNIDFAISVGAISYGFVFANCVIFDNRISLIGSTGVVFDGGEFSMPYPIIITNTIATTFKNISFVGASAGVSASGNTALRFFNNSDASGFATNGMRESVSALDFNSNNSANSYIRIKDNGTDRYIFGSDAGIAGGAAGDINSYVYGSNNYFISTNNVKRIGVSGTGYVSLLTTPTTSAGTFDFLTRNTSTGVVEKALSNTITTVASPSFTGTPTAPTAAPRTNTTQIATTAFVQENVEANTYWTKTGNNIANNNSGIVTAAGMRFGNLGGNVFADFNRYGQDISFILGNPGFQTTNIAINNATGGVLSSTSKLFLTANGISSIEVESTNVKLNVPIRLKNYTVATLPTGTQGYTAFVTDALAPTYMTTVVGGGTVVCPVFYNGTAWVAH